MTVDHNYKNAQPAVRAYRFAPGSPVTFESKNMKTIAIIILATIVSQVSQAYDHSDYLKDAKTNPEKIFNNLHPDAKEILKKANVRIKKEPEFRRGVFYKTDIDFSKKTDEELWMIMWEEFLGDIFYENMVHVDTVQLEGGKIKLHLLEDTEYKEFSGLYDNLVFKKHKDTYLPMLPEMMVVQLSSGALFADTK